ncbi:MULTISPECIES: helix-turn-helix domain-containing protein [unclassified Burkholderia]|uniref:ArsR/SmtB family transcription factor n=1 Tax=unclassified Burkholderia TaxID=2613784 RepID=UPI0009FFFD24|nr:MULTISPECIES: helix-turn-helix domain-containing protein [unclassified Burkholderia]NIF69710.1 helix-turn-helix transcriptional regulator [Burkholderia sp. Ap-962]NIF91189.1 helix-turn-helix transcriptional regulator [Burkholderia sp. Cy-637]
MPETLPAPPIDDIELGAVLAALADPLRREIVAKLSVLSDGAECGCAPFGFSVSKASLTHHFRVLRESGLIHQTDYGNRRTSHLRRADIDARFPGLLDMLRAELSAGGLSLGTGDLMEAFSPT